MEAVFDFLRAALPWIAVGLLLAVFAARSARKKKDEEPQDDYGTEGMCLGMCFGTAIGTSIGNNTGIGIAYLWSVEPYFLSLLLRFDH